VTSPEGRRNRAMPVHLELRRPETGTLLGALAWVLGALQIMRDRGRFEGDDEFEQIYQRLAPRIERLADQVAKAREATMTRPEFEEGIESAYGEVRDAFEAWIRLTAIDTLGVAVASRSEDGDMSGLDALFDDDDDEDDED
jgi:predicted secreted protein